MTQHILPATLDMQSVPALHEAWVAEGSSDQEIICDARAVQHCHGAGWQLMLAARNHQRQSGGTWRIEGIISSLAEDARWCGLNE
jgi:anti-anti-sigma regulatory factor